MSVKHIRVGGLDSIQGTSLGNMATGGWTPSPSVKLTQRELREAKPTGKGISWLYDFPEFCRTLVYIRDKSGNLVRLNHNSIQRRYWKACTNRDIILKFRQPGFSTLISADQFHRACTTPGFRGVTIAHEKEATSRLQARINLMYREMKTKPTARYNSTKELTFEALDSTLYIGTAGGRAFGRGDTVHYAHCSEVAFWPDATTLLNGLTEAVPLDGLIRLESTPNGFNEFYQLCRDARAGNSPYVLHFFPWFIHPEYRLPAECDERDYTDDERNLIEKAALYDVRIVPEQITWRRAKQKTLKDKFLQEYPEDEQTCFLASGAPRFDVQRLNRALTYAQGASVYSSERIGDTTLRLDVWETPQPSKLYCIGADSAEGKAAGDGNSACVLDWHTGAKVAALSGRCSPFRFAEALDDLGRLYNGACIAVELNHPGPAVVAKLVERNYPNLYYAPEADEPGWRTTSATRPVMVDDLDEFIDSSSVEAFPDADEIGELMSFVVGASGKAQASTGAHDDRVIARAIALQVRQHVAPPRPRKKGGWNPRQI